MTTAAPQPPTLSEVAKAAGVSLATASRAFNGSATRTVSPDNSRRVLDAARRLGYTPNLSAQAVAKGSTSTVALVVSDIADPYFSSIAAGVFREAEEAELLVTMAVTNRRPERELELVRTLRGQRPRVLILAGSRFARAERENDLIDELKAFEATGGRVVVISQRELPFATVLIDNYNGARALATSLCAQGYRSFGAVVASDELLTSRDRLRGFVDGLAAEGITIDARHIVQAEFTRAGGAVAAAELLRRGLDGIELIFAANDVMAIGVMSALRESDAGLTPGPAIAGFDDIATALDVTPALSTVRLPLEEVGAAALRLALATNTDAEPAVLTVSGEVVLRASTPPRGEAAAPHD